MLSQFSAVGFPEDTRRMLANVVHGVALVTAACAPEARDSKPVVLATHSFYQPQPTTRNFWKVLDLLPLIYCQIS